MGNHSELTLPVISENIGNINQYLISGLMTAKFIEHLEIGDVHNHDGKFPVRILHHNLRALIKESAPVQKLGQIG